MMIQHEVGPQDTNSGLVTLLDRPDRQMLSH
jgi:hypothetical protein